MRIGPIHTIQRRVERLQQLVVLLIQGKIVRRGRKACNAAEIVQYGNIYLQGGVSFTRPHRLNGFRHGMIWDSLIGKIVELCKLCQLVHALGLFLRSGNSDAVPVGKIVLDP